LEQRVHDQSVQIETRLRREATLEREAELAPLRRELEIARRIQTSILPIHPLIPRLDIATQMITASEVGGDYYDIRPTKDGCWIGIGDVAGHGLEAGLVMLMIQSGLASLIMRNPDANPHEILPPLNQMLYDNLRRRMGRDDHATLTMLRFCTDGRLLYAGAHEDILICNAHGKVRSITTHGTWVGIQEEITHELESRCIQLEENDLVVLYTDGIPESRREHECFGMARLIAEIEANYTQTARDVMNHLIDAVKDYCGGRPPQDDATLIVFRYLGQG
jgi:serine phosphatase RsbU (regulator of sigma subunit)